MSINPGVRKHSLQTCVVLTPRQPISICKEKAGSTNRQRNDPELPVNPRAGSGQLKWWAPPAPPVSVCRKHRSARVSMQRSCLRRLRVRPHHLKTPPAHEGLPCWWVTCNCVWQPSICLLSNGKRSHSFPGCPPGQGQHVSVRAQ